MDPIRLCPACGLQVNMDLTKQINRTIVRDMITQQIKYVFHGGCSIQILDSFGDDWENRQKHAEEQMQRVIDSA